MITAPSNSKTIIQISDTHLMDSPSSLFADINPEYNFHELMNNIQKEYTQIDCIIHTGDLAQEATQKTYSRYVKYMQSLKVPFHQTPGNHDDIRYFPAYQAVTVINLDPWVIVLIDSAVVNRTDGFICLEYIDRLHQVLAEHQNHFVLLGCHHHPIKMQSEWIDQHCLKNSNALFECISRHPQVKALIHGHVHQDFHQIQNGIDIYAVPSTSVQFKPLSKEFALEPHAPGYRVIELHNNGEIKTQIHRVLSLTPSPKTALSGY